MQVHIRSASGLVSAIAIATFVLAACGPGGGPSPTIGPTDAVRLVLAQDDRFTGIGVRDPDLIVQASWYEVTEGADGWTVVIRIGWGDCPAGCISEHLWTYAVGRDGEVQLIDDEGDPLPAEPGIGGIVTSGPTCPVVTDPPDPDCADRPVAGAVLVIQDPAGAEVARVSSGADGRFWVELGPGAYRVVPQPVEGLMGTAEPMEVQVGAGEPVIELAVAYDTGIR